MEIRAGPQRSFFYTQICAGARRENDVEAIIDYIQANWVPWLFAILGVILGDIIRRLRNQKKESNAIAAGVQSLLRENLVYNFNKYTDREYCPIYAKESIKRIYNAYHNLGGNDVATELYHKLLAMPEDLKEREE